MKPSIQRSNSYNYRYDPVAVSDTDDSVIEERQDSTPQKRPRTRRIVSYPGVNNPETNDTPLTTSMAENFELNAIDQDRQQDPVDETKMLKNDSYNERYNEDERGISNVGRRNVSNYRNLVLAAFLFIASLGLHFYTLSIFITKNQDSADNTQSLTNVQDSFKGGKQNAEQFGCLLTIKYTDYVKVVDDSRRDCTLTTNLSSAISFKETKLQTLQNNDTYMFTSQECLCTKQLPDKGKSYNCCICNDFFPECQNGGNRSICHKSENRMTLSEPKCGICNCFKEYTGNYCHLPKKLECVKCNGTSCDGLPPCNNSTIRPCGESFNSQKMNCTNPVNLEVKDCSSQNDTTDIKGYQPKLLLNTTDHAQKSTDQAQKSTDHAQKSCSRDAMIGYFVIDWCVFIGIIMQFTFVIIGRRCESCIKGQRWKSVHRGYIFCVLMLIIIPPIINCVTCCSKTCDTLGKLFPFIKSLSLVLTATLLYREIRRKE